MGAERTQYRYRQAERNLVDHVFLQGFDQSQSEADGAGGDDVDTAFAPAGAIHMSAWTTDCGFVLGL